MTHYTQLSQEERYTIYALLRSGYKSAAIARELNRSPSTILRELRRNTGQRGYRPAQAHCKAQGRKHILTSRIADFAKAFILHKLGQKWSPEQIQYGLTAAGWQDVPCYEWIYNFVYTLKANGDKAYLNLRNQKTYRKRGFSNNDRRGKLKDCKSIHERPVEIDERTEIGHYEGDTVVGAKHQGAVATLVERKSLFLCAAVLLSRQSQTTIAACHRLLSCVGAKSVTFDNGKEFSSYKHLESIVDVYFADPYCSNQRARNENTNRLLRQYLPKKHSLLNLEQQALDNIVNEINHRPRKTLGWLSPYQVLFNSHKVALRS